MSKTEFKLLIFLGAVAALALIYFFLYVPMQEDVSKLKSELRTTQSTMDEREQQILQANPLNEELAAAKLEKARIEGNFFNYNEQEYYLHYLQKLITDAGIHMSSLSYSGEFLVNSLGEDLALEQALPSSKEPESTPDTSSESAAAGETASGTTGESETASKPAGGTSSEGTSSESESVSAGGFRSEYQLEFDGSYPQLLKFLEILDGIALNENGDPIIDEFTEQPKRLSDIIVCSALSVGAGEEDDTLTCSLTFSFYYIDYPGKSESDNSIDNNFKEWISGNSSRSPFAPTT